MLVAPALSNASLVIVTTPRKSFNKEGKTRHANTPSGPFLCPRCLRPGAHRAEEPGTGRLSCGPCWGQVRHPPCWWEVMGSPGSTVWGKCPCWALCPREHPPPRLPTPTPARAPGRGRRAGGEGAAGVLGGRLQGHLAPPEGGPEGGCTAVHRLWRSWVLPPGCTLQGWRGPPLPRGPPAHHSGPRPASLAPGSWRRGERRVTSPRASCSVSSKLTPRPRGPGAGSHGFWKLTPAPQRGPLGRGKSAPPARAWRTGCPGRTRAGGATPPVPSGAACAARTGTCPRLRPQ